ncbi:hypothetical protein F5877DRAFT_70453 [Lentinula edodes]|nr:hypothetical protein F5877DRAFT_70453 [Lentinula edodes]
MNRHTRGSLTLPRLPELDTFFNKDAEPFRSHRASSEDSLPDPSNILEEVYTPRTVNYGLHAVTPEYHLVAPVELSSDEEVQFADPEPIAQPVSIKRGRGRPKKAPVAASHSKIILVVSSFTFELLLHLIKPDRPVAGKLKKTKGKATKQEPEKRGPIYVSSETDYAAFLSKIAGLVPTPVTGLCIQSFEWHFLSPATGPWLPINTEEGYQSMLGKLRKKHAKDEAYVIIQMKKPVQTIIPPTVESVIDEDETSDDDFLGPVAKKGKIDDELEGITQQLQSLYPVGKFWARDISGHKEANFTNYSVDICNCSACPTSNSDIPRWLSQYANGALWSISDASANAAANGNCHMSAAHPPGSKFQLQIMILRKMTWSTVVWKSFIYYTDLD